jgi:hypothetical protein
MKIDRSAEFVRNMTAGETAEPAPALSPRPSRASGKGQQPASRAGLKHFGGYLDDATLEKIALLRVRLKKDNSELIKFAIDELYAKNHAKRAFGDA